MSGTDTEAVKQKSEALSNVLKEIGTVAYQQATAASSASSNASTGEASSASTSSQTGGGQKVVDAEYKVDPDATQNKD